MISAFSGGVSHSVWPTPGCRGRALVTRSCNPGKEVGCLVARRERRSGSLPLLGRSTFLNCVPKCVLGTELWVMMDDVSIREIRKRRTFAIISHPDAGKTTLTEKLLLFGGAIQLAGTVKGRKAARHATSDWMALEQQRGISVTSSVMQFPYDGRMVNLLDTPGHEDFSEDTYRTLTAVDSALMVIDCAKGVEERTIKLMEVCRLRDTPIMTFINKLDREGREPMELLDEIEKVLKISCAPGDLADRHGPRSARHLSPARRSHLHLSGRPRRAARARMRRSTGWTAQRPASFLAIVRRRFAMKSNSCSGAAPEFSTSRISCRTPDAGLLRFGDQQFRRDGVVVGVRAQCARSVAARDDHARGRATRGEAYRLRLQDSGEHGSRASRPHRLHAHLLGPLLEGHAPVSRPSRQGNAHQRCTDFLAADRQHTDEAFAGDILGLHNHGTINIGDTFTEGESLMFTGIPNFAPEMFRRVVLRDPLRMKALQKGLDQFCEEGATQVFRPLRNNDLILGAVGQLQFDVVAFRLQDEYSVQSTFDNVNVFTARWVYCKDAKKLEEFRAKAYDNLAIDHSGALVYLAPTRVNMQLTLERWPDITSAKPANTWLRRRKNRKRFHTGSRRS